MSNLCDGKVQTDIDDDCEEKDVESSYNQQRLLQHQDLIEIIMNLETQEEIYKFRFENFFMAHDKFTDM